MADDLASLVGQGAIDAALRGAEIHAAEVELAHKAADYWRSISPVDTGTYRDSVHVKTDGGKVEVGSDDPIANLIEYGSIHNPEFAPRAKTQEHFNGGEH
jgi:hypothetical protein